MTTDVVDVKAALTEGLTELHLSTVKRIYEESARFAERETLSYERYLLDLVTRKARIVNRNESNACSISRVFRWTKH